MHACMQTFIHTYIHTYIHACMHACMHTYIHKEQTYIRTQLHYITLHYLTFSHALLRPRRGMRARSALTTRGRKKTPRQSRYLKGYKRIAPRPYNPPFSSKLCLAGPSSGVSPSEPLRQSFGVSPSEPLRPSFRVSPSELPRPSLPSRAPPPSPL